MASCGRYARAMLEDIRKKVESGIGSISKPNPDEIGAAVIGKAREAADQLTSLAVGMAEWGAAARERLASDVRELVTQTVDQMRLVSRKEFDALSARVAKLEKSSRTTRARSTASRTAKSKAATKKKSTAKSTRSSPDR
jgi:O-acetyl-ADP-ribose deacetylase (regulator of RNase III)